MAERKETKKERRRRQVVYRTAALLASLAVLLIAGVFITAFIRKEKHAASEEKAAMETEIRTKEDTLAEKRALMAEADFIAGGYDYDTAIDMLTAWPDYESDSELIDAIARYTAARSTLQAVDTTEVPHIYFHSLINDTAKAFDETSFSSEIIASMNAYMTTTEEFDEIIQEMYDSGYVLVRMRDLVKDVTNEDGETVFAVNDSLMLPAGKKPYILSVDDWSYYHQFDGMGLATRAVINDEGKVKCEYFDKNRVRRVGDYDVVPRLNTFLTEHPDGAYRGARGIIALTGVQGVFGYRTDPAYGPDGEPDAEQRAYLTAHPDFSYSKEVETAKKIAAVLKEEGWEFACHTYGHLDLSYYTLDENIADQEAWQKNVGSITGSTDIIAFTRDGDIGDWHEYNTATNALYNYYRGLGYRFFCTTDASTPTWIQIRKDYVRQGRIDCDGFQMWRVVGERTDYNVFETLFDVYKVFSEDRPTPVDFARFPV